MNINLLALFSLLYNILVQELTFIISILNENQSLFSPRCQSTDSRGDARREHRPPPPLSRKGGEEEEGEEFRGAKLTCPGALSFRGSPRVISSVCFHVPFTNLYAVNMAAASFTIAGVMADAIFASLAISGSKIQPTTDLNQCLLSLCRLPFSLPFFHVRISRLLFQLFFIRSRRELVFGIFPFPFFLEHESSLFLSFWREID